MIGVDVVVAGGGAIADPPANGSGVVQVAGRGGAAEAGQGCPAGTVS